MAVFTLDDGTRVLVLSSLMTNVYDIYSSPNLNWREVQYLVVLCSSSHQIDGDGTENGRVAMM